MLGFENGNQKMVSMTLGQGRGGVGNGGSCGKEMDGWVTKIGVGLSQREDSCGYG